jgi:hypothetical protein
MPAQSQGTWQAPAQLTLASGTWITARVNEELSSDRNQSGDTFTATLVEPLVADGYVVARRGQMIAGRVAQAERAGRTKGTSSLGLELLEISLVDGQQLPVMTEWIEYEGPTSRGSDVATVAAVTGIGAAIGAAADGGRGAGIGALAGAAASTIGVLATRGKAVVIYPESVLTFRMLEPVAIVTDRSAPVFLPVSERDYDREYRERRRVRRVYVERAPVYFFDYRPYRYRHYRYPRFYRPPVVIYTNPRPHYIYSPRIVVPRVYAPRYSPRIVIKSRPQVRYRGDYRWDDRRGDRRRDDDRGDRRGGDRGRGQGQGRGRGRR